MATAQNIKKSGQQLFGDTYKDDSCQISNLYDDFAKSWNFLRDFSEKENLPFIKEFEEFWGKMSGYKFLLLSSESTYRNVA